MILRADSGAGVPIFEPQAIMHASAYALAAMALNRPDRAAFALPVLLMMALETPPSQAGGAQQGDTNETPLAKQAETSAFVASHAQTIKTKLNQKCVCERRCVCAGCGDSQNDQRRCVYCACDESEVSCDCQYKEKMGIGQSIMQRIYYLLGIPKNS